ncbi:MAG: glycosyltransferase family 1 protein [Methyloversatilis sp.]|uniref:glycosyltransferase family 4 protein n=1 Tax=Methyloversatilis sp. TaxID=2569862 RepID=UPI0025E05225|nr:glycosyltransferase family 1 protein [Methyloversatilis sp.]MCR6666037.1 glycosyltransferase family 1 protein [Methyloversatilis sp.]
MKKNLDIVIVTDTYPPEVNGVALSIVRVVRHLRSARHRVRLVRPRQQDEAANEGDLLVRGLPLPRYPGLRFGLPAWRRLLRAWREERPDVVHIVTEGPLGWSALLAARQLGVPVTSDYRTHFDAYSSHYGLGMLSAAVRAVLRAFHNRTDLTFVPTAALEMQMKRQGYRRLVRVGRGVDTRLFNPQRRSLELRTSWGVKPHDPVFLYVGRLAPEKNLELVRAAFAAIRCEQPDARLVWVGDGPARRRMDDGRPGEIFTGVLHGSELAAHYASADIFLFPSVSETFGNVLLEAMASGLAIVAFDLAAAREHMTDGVDASLLVPACDGDELRAAASFIHAARRLARQPDRRRHLGRAARETAEGLTWPVVLNRFEAHLHACAAQPKAALGVAAAH